MDSLKKILGVVWALLGPAIIIGMIWRAATELGQVKPEKVQETYIFWIIVIAIFVPIALGLMLFGIYALRDEYKTVART
jgi:F0F1-type ATP synthase membrane subunit c/vacuolar-type H+-ATPase subunit K